MKKQPRKPMKKLPRKLTKKFSRLTPRKMTLRILTTTKHKKKRLKYMPMIKNKNWSSQDILTKRELK